MKLFMKRSGAGFTLVELIIVIVILGVLSAVAVPAYGGYVKRSREASDLQLLGAVNTAWAAACAERGIEPTMVYAAAPLDADGYIKGVTASFTQANLSAHASSTDLNSSFLRYYGDNIEKPFQVYKGLWYNKEAGTFENADGSVETTYLGKDGKTYTVTVDKADIANFDASIFSSELTTKELMGEIDKVVNAASPVLGDLAHGAKWDEVAGYMRDKLKLSDDQIAELKTDKDELANVLVLMTADAASNYTTEKLLESYNADTGTFTMSNILGGNIMDTAFEYTVPYAMVLAYANSEYSKDSKISNTRAGEYTADGYNKLVEQYGAENVTCTEIVDYSTDPFYSLLGWEGTGYLGVTVSESVQDYFDRESKNLNQGSDSLTNLSKLQSTIMQTDGFKTYMEKQGAADLDGFMSAMTMMNTNAANMDTYSLCKNGFADESIVKMLQSILGE